MLIRMALLERIRCGEVSLAFRRWRKPTVKAGGRLRTAIGELAIDAVEPCDPAGITDDEAIAAGFAGREALLAELNGRGEGEVYRIALHHAGEDGRIALREQGALTPDALDALRQRLGRLDKPRDTPWTARVLRIIATNEGLAAREIAAMLGTDKLDLKRDIRKLKELGLTESLETGYRLSPRGRALLQAM
ncbi:MULTISPECIES: hypothetical protein [unclassified Sphingopyxis]|uniref:hypothetical protein n=1 Tax=unclassified Sphingopyxis TaxID=2614943 RepID=UPI000736F783|nr:MULTISPECIES: hypothetical protein [unclassified Sphingopyxis]KTE34043.1 hypothetical protein ATE62_16540 [Sphingopyxis sp. HIX]KTE74442.1 hypothetical protein ATE72_21580 [Sphingopyxis sp. HXXIV]